MTRRPIIRPLLLALVLSALGWTSLTTPAYAGGPTSVLMVNPNAQQARAAYISDSVYADLTAAVGEGRTGSSGLPPDLAEGGGEDVRLTWLIHDVHIWRIDRVHLDTADGIWIETIVDPSGDGRMFDQPAHWHRPADAAALAAVLARAGLLGGDAQPEAAPSSVAAPEAAATVMSPPTTAPWLLLVGALGGLVLGSAGALVGVQVRRRVSADRPRVTLSG